MAKTPEAKVKDKVVKHLKEIGAYYFFPVTGGYGSSGIPDIVACYKGVFVGIECKAGKNRPTKLQQKHLDINACGGYAIVINEDNVALVDKYLGLVPILAGVQETVGSSVKTYFNKQEEKDNE